MITNLKDFGVALLAEGVDRNTAESAAVAFVKKSPSSRRAGIEIICARRVRVAASVALLAEGVDRNVLDPVAQRLSVVALLAEGVDINSLTVATVVPP